MREPSSLQRNIQVLHCNSCRVDTHHEARSKGESKVVHEALQVILAWKVLECCGCGDIALEVQTRVEGQPEGLEYFPERLDRKIPLRFFRAPRSISHIYNEVVSAFNHTSPQPLNLPGMPLLCAIGLRTLLEGILTDKGIKDGPGPN